MKLLIFGNIASGKSTICRLLLSELSDFEYVAVDCFRQRFGDGSQLGETTALREFELSLKPGANQIVEAMGLGKTAEIIANRIPSDEPVFIVILSTSPELCLMRLTSRNEFVPYPDNRDRGRALLLKSVELYKNFITNPYPFINHKVQIESFSCNSLIDAHTIVASILQKVIIR